MTAGPLLCSVGPVFSYEPLCQPDIGQGLLGDPEKRVQLAARAADLGCVAPVPRLVRLSSCPGPSLRDADGPVGDALDQRIGLRLHVRRQCVAGIELDHFATVAEIDGVRGAAKGTRPDLGEDRRQD